MVRCAPPHAVWLRMYASCVSGVFVFCAFCGSLGFASAPPAPGSHPAFGRLCLALAALCLRFGSCGDVIHGVVAVLGTSTAALPSVYQLLKHIPEEVRAAVRITHARTLARLPTYLLLTTH